MERFSDFPLRARVYLIGWWALGFPTLVFEMVTQSNQVCHAVMLPVVLAALLLGGRKVILTRAQPGKGPGASMSVSFVTTYLVLLFYGPAPAVLAASAGEIGRGIVGPKRYHWYQVLFNLASVGVATALAAWVYQKCGGICRVPDTDREFPVLAALDALDVRTWRALTGSVLVFYAINTFSIAGVVSLVRGEALMPLWRSSFLWTAPGYFAAASFAGLARGATIALGPWALLMALPIATLIYTSYRTYIEKVEQHEQHIERLKVEQKRLDEVYHSALESLALAIDAKDKYTRKHISRVQIYAVAIARHMGVGPVQMQAIRTAALLHDIGKLAVPEQILVKPGKLTQEEFRRMKAHVTTGVMMLKPVDFPWPVIPIVESHHERWDGNGYPQGLKGEEIPLGGRIVGLADFFDAVTSDRPYHRAMPVEEAMSKVRARRGTHFDPQVADAFFAIYESVRAEIDEVNTVHVAPDPGEPSPAERKRDLLQALDEIGRASDELYTLYETVHPLGRSLDLRETLRLIVEKTHSIVPFDTGAVFWRSEDREELRAEITAGLYERQLLGMTIKVGEGLSGWVARHGTGIVNRPASMDVARKLSPQDEIELNSSLVAPLVLEGRTMGTISLYSCQLHFYTEEHLRLLTIVADHAATAIENARRFEETRELAMTDALTGLPNARALAGRLAQEIERCGREGRRLALVLVDLDNFKAINDRLGHEAGDRRLCEVAQLLTAVVCSDGFVSRYAGDEFVIVLPEATRPQADRLAGRVQAALTGGEMASGRGGEGARARGGDSPSAPSRPRPLAPSPREGGASVGVALYPEDAGDARALIHCADRRMYQDKFERKVEPPRGGIELVGASAP